MVVAASRLKRVAVGSKFAQKLSEDALNLGEDTKLRGTEVTTLLQQAGYTFSSEDPNPKFLRPIAQGMFHKADTLYDLSKDVDHIDTFVSHSWRDPRFTKFLSLALHFRAWNAILWSMVPTMIAFVVQNHLASTGQMAGLMIMASFPQVKMNGLCHLTWGASFLLMLFLGAPTPFRPVYCFLDRLCIHQTDAALKRRGIDSLGGFLAHSKRMVVIYSSSYITRLWCMFELAAKVRTHGVGAIDLMPTAVCGAVGTPCIGCLAVSAMMGVAAAIGFVSLDAVNSSPFIIGMLPVFLLNCIMPFQMAGSLQAALRTTEEEISSLSVDKLECYMERDRHFVEGCMRRWYGSKENFEKTVQVDLLNDIKRRGILRRVPCFTYNQAVIVYFHTLVMHLDTVAFTPWAITVRRAPVVVASVVVTQPLLLAWFTAVAEGCFHLHKLLTRALHAKTPKAPVWLVGFVFCFVPYGVWNAICMEAPTAFTLETNMSWTLALLYVTLKLYHVTLPKPIDLTLLLTAISACVYLANTGFVRAKPCVEELPPACHFALPRGCVPSNANTASCTFSLLGDTKCAGVGF